MLKNRLHTLDSTWSAGASPRRQLAAVLEGYLADLERGAAPDEATLLAEHPELAAELRPYLDSLRLLHGATRELRTAKGASPGISGQPAEPGARHIGDYRIVREIGRGGMGIVYEAHQESLNRQVALKVLPFAAVLDQRQIARFRNEAQAAAQLHHPHIVPVFAVGQEQGVYYYAMQYISGQSLEQAIAGLKVSRSQAQRDSPSHAPHGNECPAALRREQDSDDVNPGFSIDSSFRAAERPGRRSHLERANQEDGYAPQRSQPTRPVAAHSTLRSKRSSDYHRTVARLGKEAAEALEHAHEYGIIHRDIKPSNLLLDDAGKLWVTDFGLARMQAGSGVTLTGDVVGTLRYMSPEQASGQTALIDARTDVYSLGVTLYELLTQRPAFPGDDRQGVMRQIAESEPIAPRRFDPDIPVDLETIVLSAMAKTREERYASAKALADDLQRFLAGEPTLARRPTVADRVAKWARRHRPLVLLAACALVAITVVSAVGLVLLAREQGRTSMALEQARNSAVEEIESFARAERHYQQARGAADRFGMRLADRLLDIPGAESVRREVLLETLAFYRQFMADAGDDPRLRHELALAQFKSGVIAARLGAAADAAKAYEAAQQLFGELSAEDSSPETLRQLAVTHNNLGLLLAGQGDVKRARGQYAAAIEIQTQLAREHPGELDYTAQLAESQANLAMLLEQIGEVAEAEHSLRAAVDALRPLASAAPRELRFAHQLAIVYNNLSFVLRKRDADEAERASQQAIALLTSLVQRDPAHVQFQDDLALCFNNRAALESHRVQLQSAIKWYGEAIALQEQLVRKAPAVVRHRSDLAITLNNLGVAYCRARSTNQADDAFRRARELFATLAADYPDELAYQSSLASLLNNQALALADAGRSTEALGIYPKAIQSQHVCWQHRKDSPLMREVLSKMYYNYGQSLRSAGRFDEAAKVALARRDVWEGNGERLVGVAAEIAEIIAAVDGKSAASQVAKRDWVDEVVATLRLAQQCGWPTGIDLAADERFALLRDDQRFAALIEKVTGRRVTSGDGSRDLPNEKN